jgi:hypothetical protein
LEILSIVRKKQRKLEEETERTCKSAGKSQKRSRQLIKKVMKRSCYLGAEMNDNQRHDALTRALFLKRVVTSILEDEDADPAIRMLFQEAQADLESLERLLTLRKIGIFGRMSGGKSSVFNQLLRIPEMFRTGDGATSAVPTEIRRSSDGQYRATIKFYSVEDAKQDLSFCLAPSSEEDTPEKRAILSRLWLLFDLEQTNLDDDQTLLNDEVELTPNRQTPKLVPPMLGMPAQDYIDFVGREPLILETDTAETLMEWVRPFLELDINEDKLLPFIVTYVTIE